MLSRVFELFAQVDRSLDRSQGGLGLGLTLVRSLVEMHGGSVEAASAGWAREASSWSDCRSGSRRARPRRIARPASTPTGTPPVASRRAPRARKVLVVDDNVTSAQSLELLLRLEGHEARWFMTVHRL